MGNEEILLEVVQERRTFCCKRDILDRIGEVKGISEDDRCNLEKEIMMEEVSNTLKDTKNVAPGAGGFTGSFYKVFWCFLKKKKC